VTAIRMAQYGTKHGHAAGKLRAMQRNPDVDVVGVFEPDAERRDALTHSDGPFQHVHWFDSEQEMLGDETIVAVASEGRNDESLKQTAAIVRAGKHAWYDKPAGDDWAQWQQVVATAQEQQRIIQMGYMFRYHNGFRQIADWVQAGMLGDVFALRAHMSTAISPEQRAVINVHRGGIFYDLAGHMLDQVVWLLGRPARVTAFLRNDDHRADAVAPGFADNALGVFEFENAIAFVDIAAMETRPMARRFEVYGTRGSAIIVDPFEPATAIRLCLDEARDGYQAGEQIVSVEMQARQDLYELELAAFLKTITGQQPPDRSYAHELLVQETLLRAAGYIEE